MKLQTKIKRSLTENIPLKAAALIIAIILWLFVTSKGQTEISLDVPIDFINIPQGLDIVRYDVKSANIVIKGYEGFIKNIKPGDIRVNVDLSKAKKGEASLPITKKDIRLPYTLSLMKIEPSSVKVYLEEKMTKKVPIRPVITGRPERGYDVKTIEIRPEDMKIEGVVSELRKINFLNTEPIDIAGLREDLTQEVGLDLQGKKVRPEKDKVEVMIRIKRRGR